MKCYIIEEDNGLDYLCDDYDHWISAILMVPDDFDPEGSYKRFLEDATKAKWIRLTKSGGVYAKDIAKLVKLYNQYLKNLYSQIEIVNKDPRVE